MSTFIEGDEMSTFIEVHEIFRDDNTNAAMLINTANIVRVYTRGEYGTAVLIVSKYGVNDPVFIETPVMESYSTIAALLSGTGKVVAA